MCPTHPTTRLTLEAQARLDANGEVLQGWLRCPFCPKRYRITQGIADLLGSSAPPDSPAQMINYLPLTAWGYERLWRPYALTLLTGEPFGYRRELPLITGLMAPEREGLYVDVACSNGLYARSIARRLGNAGGHVVGVDHAMPMLRQARSFARQDGLRISFVRARAQALPFRSADVTGVAMGGSLNEIGDLHTCLREMRRVLAPDGRLVTMNLLQTTSSFGRALQYVFRAGGVDFCPLRELNTCFTAYDLHLVAQWRYRIVLFSLLLARPLVIR